MEEIEKKVELSYLAAFYGGMLTGKQREVLALHCEEDLSLGEIAREAGITRQGVHDLLTRAAQKLFSMEEKLHMGERFARLEQGLMDVKQALSENDAPRAQKIVDQLMVQEESNGL